MSPFDLRVNLIVLSGCAFNCGSVEDGSNVIIVGLLGCEGWYYALRISENKIPRKMFDLREMK